MMSALRIFIAGFLLIGTAVTLAQADADYADGGSERCISCHDFGPESPVHALMAGSHTTAGTDDVKDRRGCEDCHGPSANHASAPTQVSPGVSFGPRWSASIAAQDGKCLACHEENVAKHWKDSLHMVNNVTCVSCHDVHTSSDRVLFASQQSEVCTVCHKVQKEGVHGLQKMVKRNPQCSSCHNPHDHESAETQMLLNRSEGCRACHDLVKMARSERVSDKAKNYHKVMVDTERTCLECHGGIAHAEADSVTAFAPAPSASRDLTLFFPGAADSEWLVQKHPGSQPLRQGATCQQCHRGEEAAIGRARAGDFEPAFRSVRVSVASDPDAIRVTLRWKGSRDEADISFMWGTQDNEVFQRGGCFAACHSDMPGMSKDRGQRTSKYLWTSREQQQGVGQPAIIRDDAELKQLMDRGQFLVLWRIDLNSGKAETAALLEKLNWQPGPAIRASTSYKKGMWEVNIRRALTHQSGHLMEFDPEGKYTFGIALHGADNPGGKHWVSLPLTFSYRGDDTDFAVE